MNATTAGASFGCNLRVRCEYRKSLHDAQLLLLQRFSDDGKDEKKWSCRLARVLLFYNIDLYSRSRRCCVMLYNGPLLSAGFYTEILSDECGLLGNERKEKGKGKEWKGGRATRVLTFNLYGIAKFRLCCSSSR